MIQSCSHDLLVNKDSNDVVSEHGPVKRLISFN